jgi:hypothetical protein
MWLLFGLAVLAVLVSRLSRSLGSVGIILTVVLVIVVAALVREHLRSRSRPTGPNRSRAATKNVTPHEPALQPGAVPSQGSVVGPTPSVIIVDTPDGTERLATRLQALDRLRADGLVTEEEYESKRAQLIADF